MHQYSNKNFLFFSIFLICLSFLMLQGFFFGILWGIVVAIAIFPITELIQQKNIKFLNYSIQKNAFIYTVIFTIIFIFPIIYGILQIPALYDFFNELIKIKTERGISLTSEQISFLPFNIELATWWNQNIASNEGFKNLASKINTQAVLEIFVSLSSQIFEKIFVIFVMIISLYFSLKNSLIIKENYSKIITYWFGSKMLQHTDNAVKSLRGTVNGIILVGIVEGIILSIPLLMGGISSGLLVGLIAGIAGVIPLLMPILILPFLIFLLLTNQVFWAITGFIVLGIVWLIFENFIKPQVISKEMNVNSLLILAAMIGGMQIMGLVGLFIGPTILAITIAILKEICSTAINKKTTD